MAIDVATLKANLILDSSRFTKSASSSNRALGALGKAAKVGGLAMGAGLAVGVKKAYSEFIESEKAMKQTNAVLKSTQDVANVTAQGLESLANKVSLKAGMDDEAIQSAGNLLLTFTNVRNELGKGNDVFSQAIPLITDMSVALGQDLKSSTIQVGKALNDPIKGVTSLRKVGVAFTEQQTEQIKKMVESGNVMGAQKTILKELATEFQGSAAAQATGSEKAKAALDNLFEAFGQTFGPAINTALTATAKFIGQMQSGEGAGGRFADTIRSAFSTVKDVVTAVVGRLGQVMGGLANAAGSVAGVLAKIGAAVGQVLGPVASFVARIVPAGVALRALNAAIGATVGFLVAFAARWVAVTAAAQVGKFIAMVGAIKNVGSAFAALKAILIANPLTALAVAAGAVAGALGLFGGKAKAQVPSIRDLNSELRAQADLMSQLKGLTATAAEAGANLELAQVNLARANRDAASATQQYGADSLQAQEATANATIAGTAFARAQQTVSDNSRQAGNTIEEVKEKTDATTKGFQAHKAALEKVIPYMKATGASASKVAKAESQLSSVNQKLSQAQEDSATASAAMASRFTDLFSAATKGISPLQSLGNALKALSGVSFGGVLGGLSSVVSAASKASESIGKAKARASSNEGNAADGIFGRIKTQLQEISSMAGKEEFLGTAIKGLDNFVSKDKKIDKLHKSVVRARTGINQMLTDISRTKIRTDAFDQLRDQIEGKVSAAAEKFRSTWEQTMGRTFDKNSRAQMSAFDKETQNLISTTAEAQEIAKLRAEQESASRKAEEEALAARLAAAQAEGDATEEAAVRAEMAKAASTQRIAELEATQAATSAQIEAARAEERIALEQSLADQREQIQADATDQYTSELRRRLDAELAQLEQSKQGYKQFVQDVRDILGGLGFDFQDAIALGIEAPPAPGLGLPKARKKPKKKKKRALGGPVMPGQSYLVGEEGPELVSFGNAGRVHSARQTEGMLGQSVNQTFNVYPSANLSADAVAARLGWLAVHG